MNCIGWEGETQHTAQPLPLSYSVFIRALDSYRQRFRSKGFCIPGGKNPPHILSEWHSIVMPQTEDSVPFFETSSKHLSCCRHYKVEPTYSLSSFFCSDSHVQVFLFCKINFFLSLPSQDTTWRFWKFHNTEGSPCALRLQPEEHNPWGMTLRSSEAAMGFFLIDLMNSKDRCLNSSTRKPQHFSGEKRLRQFTNS